jgi:hypothetical protein
MLDHEPEMRKAMDNGLPGLRVVHQAEKWPREDELLSENKQMKTYRTLIVVLSVLVFGLGYLLLSKPGKTASEPPKDLWHTNTVVRWETNTLDIWHTNTLDRWHTNTVDRPVTTTVTLWQTNTVEKPFTNTLTVWQTNVVDRWHTNTVDRPVTTTLTLWHTNVFDRWHTNTVELWHTNTVDRPVTTTVTLWHTNTVDKWQTNTLTLWQTNTVERPYTNIVVQWETNTVDLWHTNTVSQRYTNTLDLWHTNTVVQRETNTVEMWHTNTVVQNLTNEVIKEVAAQLSPTAKQAVTAGFKYLNAPISAGGIEALYGVSTVAVDVVMNGLDQGLTAEHADTVRKSAEGILRDRSIPISGTSPHRLVVTITLLWKSDVPRVAIIACRLDLKEKVAIQRQGDVIRSDGIVWSTADAKLVRTFQMEEELKTAVQDQLEKFCSDYLKAKETEGDVKSRIVPMPQDLLSGA